MISFLDSAFTLSNPQNSATQCFSLRTASFSRSIEKLSSSSKGSMSGVGLQLVVADVEVTELEKELDPQFDFEAELELDTGIVPELTEVADVESGSHLELELEPGP